MEYTHGASSASGRKYESIYLAFPIDSLYFYSEMWECSCGSIDYSWNYSVHARYRDGRAMVFAFFLCHTRIEDALGAVHVLNAIRSKKVSARETDTYS